MSSQEGTGAEEYFTDFDGRLKARLGRVVPTRSPQQQTEGRFAGISARYHCIVKIEYQSEIMRLLEEGMENVWERHKTMAEFVKAWARENFELFAPEEYASNTLTCVKNSRGINVAETIAAIQQKHNTIFGNGYGKLKEETFRIAHMGDMTLDEVKELLGWIDEEIS